MIVFLLGFLIMVTEDLILSCRRLMIRSHKLGTLNTLNRIHCVLDFSHRSCYPLLLFFVRSCQMSSLTDFRFIMNVRAVLVDIDRLLGREELRVKRLRTKFLLLLNSLLEGIIGCYSFCNCVI